MFPRQKKVWAVVMLAQRRSDAGTWRARERERETERERERERLRKNERAREGGSDWESKGEIYREM